MKIEGNRVVFNFYFSKIVAALLLSILAVISVLFKIFDGVVVIVIFLLLYVVFLLPLKTIVLSEKKKLIVLKRGIIFISRKYELDKKSEICLIARELNEIGSEKYRPDLRYYVNNKEYRRVGLTHRRGIDYSGDSGVYLLFHLFFDRDCELTKKEILSLSKLFGVPVEYQ